MGNTIHTGSSADAPSWARWVNIGLGVWLFVSAFLWPHADPSFTNTWIMGVVIAGLGIAAMGASGARWLNTSAGIWVFFAAFALPHRSLGTVWNNAFVGAAVFLLAFVPNLQRARRAATT